MATTPWRRLKADIFTSLPAPGFAAAHPSEKGDVRAGFAGLWVSAVPPGADLRWGLQAVDPPCSDVTLA